MHESLNRSNSTYSAPTDSPAAGIPENAVGMLFMRLAVHYGQKWTGQFTSDKLMALAKEEWRRGLHGCTGEDIERGLHVMKRQCLEWPPTLPQFAAFCRKPEVLACHRPFQALPKPAPNVALGLATLSGWREALGGRRGRV